MTRQLDSTALMAAAAVGWVWAAAWALHGIKPMQVTEMVTQSAMFAIGTWIAVRCGLALPAVTSALAATWCATAGWRRRPKHRAGGRLAAHARPALAVGVRAVRHSTTTW
jgi:hypothetical protein